MSNEYRVETAGREFAVIDPGGVRVGTYGTEHEAKPDVERCKRDDAMYETAKQLVDAAITAHAKMFAARQRRWSQRGDGNSFPLDGLNRGKLPVYVWF